MDIRIIASLALMGWATTTLSYEMDSEFLDIGGDSDPEGFVTYQETCEAQRARDPSMSDEEYTDAMFAIQDTDCAIIFKPGDIGYGGGKVFHVTDEGRHGMEIAPDHHTTVEYGCWEVDLEGARDRSFGAGKFNTDVALENDCVSYYGGTIIFDVLLDYNAGGVNDWYIPSMGELYEIHEVLGPYTVTEKRTAHPSYPQFFWSSSQKDKNWMWTLNLTDGIETAANNPVKLSVLFIRNF
ncbi:hypothetical protein bplSymb_SCF02601P036 [Bathymodiolus platifrons methanotrophic gill symbiont]|uniref:hypothetical protein n=1 Tax=Bathymodiolus platifrons methanotrophic gill symbiont TaxID=113268 RepID=UPI000B412519|nr:hypothetical protein [Bathymodiolus platifrons methanotrophic gill symbiont]GAW86401.1 hypothetical protein bplSymb_SCF02601P036 [Bathymodiolus platifrons methanotrophic gill symbiont]